MSIEDRFQVVDEDCGLVSTVKTKDEALDVASHHSSFCLGQVEVFDTMAHPGTEQTWSHDGRLLTRRQPSGDDGERFLVNVEWDGEERVVYHMSDGTYSGFVCGPEFGAFVAASWKHSQDHSQFFYTHPHKES